MKKFFLTIALFATGWQAGFGQFQIGTGDPLLQVGKSVQATSNGYIIGGLIQSNGPLGGNDANATFTDLNGNVL